MDGFQQTGNDTRHIVLSICCHCSRKKTVFFSFAPSIWMQRWKPEMGWLLPSTSFGWAFNFVFCWQLKRKHSPHSCQSVCVSAPDCSAIILHFFSRHDSWQKPVLKHTQIVDLLPQLNTQQQDWTNTHYNSLSRLSGEGKNEGFFTIILSLFIEGEISWPG